MKNVRATIMKEDQMTLTRELVYAAGRDAGYRSMRAAGRTVWNEDDYNAAAETVHRLMPFIITGLWRWGPMAR
jgi:hypothetical protein